MGYLALSISKSSGGFFGMMTLTSGEWEVEAIENQPRARSLVGRQVGRDR